MKRVAVISVCLVLLILCIASAGCIFTSPTVDTTVSKADEMGIALNISKDDFEAAGFTVGDLINITLASNETIYNVPYLDGTFFHLINITKLSPEKDNIITLSFRNTGEEKKKISQGEKITITRAIPLGSALLQRLGSFSYSNNPNDYPSEESFANFRVVNVGNLKDNLIYRGASPVDNQRYRAAVVDRLIENKGIRTDFNLSDTSKSLTTHMEKSDFNSPYFASLYKNGDVIISGIGINFIDKKTKETLAKGFIAMSEKDGPYYIHCIEGKDRTGLVCLILELLADATYEETLKDFMTTYENYYRNDMDSINYDLIKSLKFDDMITLLTKNGTLSLKEGAKQYLREGGMTDEQIERLIFKITK